DLLLLLSSSLLLFCNFPLPLCCGFFSLPTIFSNSSSSGSHSLHPPLPREPCKSSSQLIREFTISQPHPSLLSSIPGTVNPTGSCDR
ncbi:hypothetical protein BDQ94DRAFT_150157, partial [Aspergillus welwitschiae]